MGLAADRSRAKKEGMAVMHSQHAGPPRLPASAAPRGGAYGGPREAQELSQGAAVDDEAPAAGDPTGEVSGLELEGAAR